MTTVLLGIATLTGISTGFAALLGWLKNRYPAADDELVDAIERLLPLTQCAQCGYPGCRPYAEAIADGAPLDLCPPGGPDTQIALARLLDRDPGARLEPPRPAIARIDESACIGCTFCMEACPVDAIVGARHFMHTVIESRCTGCELCLPPCPVDCIELIPIATVALKPAPADTAVCIRCNRCEPVCPEGLEPQTLWWLSRDGEEQGLDAARDHGLDACIECGLCNAECPAGIDLAGLFASARSRLAHRDQAGQRARRAGQLAAERQARLERETARAAERRARRLAGFKRRQRGGA